LFFDKTKGKRILIDPGDLEFNEKWVDEDWKNINTILVTHKHGDHCNINIINKIIKRDNIKLYTTQEVLDFYPFLINPEIIKEGDVFNVDNTKVVVVKAVHGYISLFKNTNKGIQENVGYIIDDSNKKLYHTSDSISFENNYKCDILLIPICNHGIVMGSWGAALFAKDINSEIVIPMHYDNPKYPVDFEKAKQDFADMNINYKFLEFGESVEV